MTAPRPDISLVVCAYKMARELPRTLETLAAPYQQGISELRCEVIVVDNGSDPPIRQAELAALVPNLRILRPDAPDISPVAGINLALADAAAPLIGLFIDGARMASPGILRLAHQAWQSDPSRAIGTLAFHLGPDVQMVTVSQGYDQAAEDRLLASISWREEGYRLFDISVLAGSSQTGWNGPIGESNGLFMDRALWDRVGRLDPRFRAAGGGFCNLELWDRAVAGSDHHPWIILGEGTFHQVHGGAATNGTAADRQTMADEYAQLFGHPFRRPAYTPRFIGSLDTLGANRARLTGG